jgi:TrmH family RNA methyltransferase
MKRIVSRRNPLVARYRAVERGEHPELILLDGPHLIRDAVDAGLHIRHALVAASALDRREVQLIITRLEDNTVDLATASAPVMAAASPVRSSSAIVAIADRPASAGDRVFAGSAPLVVAACDVQDPGNLGAIARAAEAGGASGMVVAGQSADPFGWKALRGSMGSALRLPLAVYPSPDQVLDEVRRHGCRVLAAVPRNSRSIFDLDLKGPLAIFVGSEGSGLPQALIDAADERVSVPMQAPVESLNTAVSAAVMIYEAYRQRRR